MSIVYRTQHERQLVTVVCGEEASDNEYEYGSYGDVSDLSGHVAKTLQGVNNQSPKMVKRPPHDDGQREWLADLNVTCTTLMLASRAAVQNVTDL